jgi:integrase
MSVHRREGRDGRYEVRWREGGRQRSRSFAKKGDAQAFELDVKRRRQLGPLAAGVLQSRLTLAEFVSDEWWPRYAVPNLKPSTRRRYLEVWGTHLLPRIGDYQLREITPALVEDLCGQFRAAGVGVQTQRKAVMLLQGILRRAVVRGLIPANPVSVVDKPRQPPTRRPQPFEPLTVEHIRARLGQRDATLVSVLAYAGLRPAEATSARWDDLGERILHVHASKTERARVVDVLAPLAQDLAEWRLALGRPPTGTLIFPRAGGHEWQLHDWQNWRRRIYQPAATAAGVSGDMRPYRLRSSFVSLLLWEGRSLTYVADQAGHSVATLASHYAGVLRELEDQPRTPATEAIRSARDAVGRAPDVRQAELMPDMWRVSCPQVLSGRLRSRGDYGDAPHGCRVPHLGARYDAH